MRNVTNPQLQLGELDIADIHIDTRSRDDIPQLLQGLQTLYTDKTLRAELFSVLEKLTPADIRTEQGRPGMTLWNILVMGTLKLNKGKAGVPVELGLFSSHPCRRHGDSVFMYIQADVSRIRFCCWYRVEATPCCGCFDAWLFYVKLFHDLSSQHNPRALRWVGQNNMSIGMVKRESTIGDETTIETRYFIGSIQAVATSKVRW